MDSAAAPYIGQMAGPYRLSRKLDEGAMGAVYEARQEAPGTDVAVRVAVKVMTSELSRSPRYVARFLNEVQLAAQLHHPGIVQIVSFGTLTGGTPYLAMEFLDGISLARHLLASSTKQRGLPLSFVVPIAHQIAVALATAHEQQIVHRDLKPSNVMLLPSRSSPGGWQVKIVDFGIAKKLYDDGVPAAGSMVPGPADESGAPERASTIYGTPLYMAPEGGLRSSPVDPRLDVYALGVMMYEMLAGEPPFCAASATGLLAMHSGMPPAPLRPLAPGSPRLLIQLVHRMLAKPVQERPTMRQCEESLFRLLDLLRPARRRPLLVPILALSLAAGAAGMGLIAGQQRSAQVGAPQRTPVDVPATASPPAAPARPAAVVDAVISDGEPVHAPAPQHSAGGSRRHKGVRKRVVKPAPPLNPFDEEGPILGRD